MTLDPLDALLERSAPAARDADSADLRAMIASAKQQTRPTRRRRIGVVAGVLSLVPVGGAGVATASSTWLWGVLLTLAAISLGWISWWTFYAATSHSGPRPAGETGWGLWAVTVLPAIILCTIGLLVGAVGVSTRRSWSRVALWCGIGLMIAGTALQLGVGIATFLSAGLLAAAGVARTPAR